MPFTPPRLRPGPKTTVLDPDGYSVEVVIKTPVAEVPE